MIEIRRPSKKECEDAKELICGFKEFDIENSAFIFDGEKILGAADFKSDGKTALLNNLLVVGNQEFLIDGLVKALINIADVRKHDYFAVKKEEREEFYIKIGFRKIQNQMEFDGMKMKESDYLYAKLPEFFRLHVHVTEERKLSYGRFLQNFNELSKYISENILGEGSVAVDCTVGNGNDTLYLAQKVGRSGRVYGFDVQEAAIARARERLEGGGLADRVQLILDGHENMNMHIHEEIDFAVFNLGYLPKGDHSITTKSETTLKAVASAIEKLKPKGAVSIMAYIGHDGGNDENTALRSFIEGLDSRRYNVVCTNFINKPNNPPILYLVQKNR